MKKKRLMIIAAIVVFAFTAFSVLSASFAYAYPSPNEYIIGDVDGDCNIGIVDALLVLRYVSGLIQLNQEQLQKADYDQNGIVNTVDVLVIMRVSLNLCEPYYPPSPTPAPTASPAEDHDDDDVDWGDGWQP